MSEVSMFYARNLKLYKQLLIDWATICQHDPSVKCFKMNRFTYDQLKGEVVDSIIVSTKDIMDLEALESYLTSVPIIFDNSIVDYMIKTEDEI